MKNKLCNGSITVEMSFLMPMILFLILSCILAVFYYHDKNIISGVAYETAVVGSTKAREREGVTACLLYTSPSPRDISGSRMPSSA